MESRLVPAVVLRWKLVDFPACVARAAHPGCLPLAPAQAMWSKRGGLAPRAPDVVVGLGGYITFPAG
jgi:hypothetical protein